MDNSKLKRIKEEDDRAFSKFFVILIIAMIIGGVLGIITCIASNTNIADMTTNGIIYFLSFVSPYAMITVTAVITMINIILYKKSRSIYNNWDGENEDDMSRIETLLNYAMWFSSLNMILSFFFFATGIGLDSIKNSYHILEILRFMLLYGGFCVAMVSITLEQQKIINFEKEMNPEKKGSVFDMRFAKKWEESSDEAEKLTIYKSAYKSYQTVNLTCIFLWLICIIGSGVWDFGILPIAMVTIIWTVLVSSYSLEAIRLTKNPSEIHK